MRNLSSILASVAVGGALLITPEEPTSTTITFTRAQISQMAALWETDGVAISPLANAQYPGYAGSWQFIFPHSSISADGDVHSDLAVDSSGSGASGNNFGESPIVAEIINASTGQLNHLATLARRQANFRGIFRFYTEHSGERHFEVHPALGLDLWNGASFVADSDYHGNIVADPNGTTHTSSTLVNLLNGSQTITAAIQSDNASVDFTFPSPSVNYVEYPGTALSTVQRDSVSQYFLFRPDLVPTATVRCRLIAGTIAANASTGLTTGRAITVNALTRTDLAGVETQIAALSPGQSRTFARPVELILLGIYGVAPAPTPTPVPSPSATPTPTPSATPAPSPSATATPLGTATPSPSPTPNASATPGVFGNLSTRLRVSAGDDVMIGGFILRGNAPKRVIVRALGPSVPVPGALSDPTLELHDSSGALLAQNDNWRDNPNQQEIIDSRLAPPDSREAALLATLAPGAYTAIIRGSGNATGIALTEVFDLDPASDSRLANISTRGRVETGDNVMIGGFIVSGTTAVQSVLRAVGPSLPLMGTLSDPTLELHDANGVTIAYNDDWRTGPDADFIASTLPPRAEEESALYAALPPGAYTAIVRGKQGATGIALVEIFQIGQ
ncbi:MAG: hypothetical protein M3Y80_03200 [Verrucomicrobiota bacterium]|nr:hypothetical protein [Verrucomicrobiota bacterium]